MKSLVTGGFGYIGSVVVPLLLKNNIQVRVVDNNLYDNQIDLNSLPDKEKKLLSVTKLDVRDPKIAELIEDCDVVVNLAAIVGDPACLNDTKEAIEVNCTGTKNIVEACKEHSKRIIHISTCSVYGSEPNKVLKEDTNAYAIDFYGITKAQQEKLIMENIEEKNYVILRLGTAHGLSPRMRYDLVVNSFVAKAINTGEITVFGGEQKRPFVHIMDIARAVLMGINTHDLHGVYNFANENVSIRDLASFIKDKINCKITIRDDIADKRDYIADNSKILKTGFKFEWNIEKSIDEISKSQTAKESDKAKYHNNKWLLLKKMDIKL